MSSLILCCALFSTVLPLQGVPSPSGESSVTETRPVQARSVQARPVQARPIQAQQVQPGSAQMQQGPSVSAARSQGGSSTGIGTQNPGTQTPGSQTPGSRNPGSQNSKTQNIKDKNEVLQILDSLEKVMGELKDSNHRVKNLKKVLVVLESGKVKVGEEDKVKANKALRIVVITGLRSLRASARQIGSEIRITVLPKKRGLLSKLRARRELIEDKSSQVRYDRMIGQMNQEITLIEQQEQILQTNLRGLSAAISLMEGQLDFLDMVQESIQLGQKVGEQLRELNKELDQVVDRLVRNQLGQ